MVPHIGVAEEVGVGSYATATVGQLGARVYVYPSDEFSGVQLGVIARSNMLVYPSSRAVMQTPSDVATATEVFDHDVQLARANGRSSLFFGGSVGLKGIASGVSSSTGQPYAPGLRGLTIAIALDAGYVHIVGDAPYGAAQSVTLGDAGVLLFEFRLGWTL